MKLIQKKNSPGMHVIMPTFIGLQALTSGRMEEAFYALLYDPSKNHKALHTNSNELRTKLCVTTNDTMAKLPLCEPVFIPKVKRSVCQAKQWVNARDPSANLGSVFDQAEKKLT